MDIEIPNETIAGEDIRLLLENPNLQRRGDNYFREAIRYLQAPYGDIHQESREPSVLQKRLAHLTIAILRSFSADYLTNIISDLIQDWLKNFEKPIFSTNLFLEIRPLMISLWFKLLFNQKISQETLLIYSQAIANLHDTLKGNALRSLSIRLKMYEDIKKRLDISLLLRFVKEKDLEGIAPEILVKHISCTFFHTGVVQTTEFICHTLTEIYKNKEIFEHLQPFINSLNLPLQISQIDNFNYLENVLNESLRLFPLLGKTNREVSSNINFKDIVLEKGSVVYIDFRKSHTQHWDEAEIFKPSRWNENSSNEAQKNVCKEHFMPFGVGPRSCPAESFARNTTKIVIVNIMKYLDLRIPNNFVHTRRIPQGVPVVISLNSYAQKFKPLDTMDKSNLVSAEDLVISLEKKLDSIDKSESMELSITNILGKIFKDLKKGHFNFRIFYPLIRDIDIWFNFQRKRLLLKSK